MQRISFHAVTMTLILSCSITGAFQLQSDVVEEQAVQPSSSALALGQRLAVLESFKTRRNTPDFWKGVTDGEYLAITEGRRGVRQISGPDNGWINRNGGPRGVDPFLAIEEYCNNPPAETLPTTTRLTAKAEQKDIQFGEVTTSILELQITISDVFSLRDIGEQMRIYYRNFDASGSELMTIRREDLIYWRKSGSRHRSVKIDDKTATVKVYLHLPFEGADGDYDPSTVFGPNTPKDAWTGKDLFVGIAGKPGYTSTPMFRLTKNEKGWAGIPYTSPEYCGVRMGLDFYLKHVSGISLRDLIKRETGMTIDEFRENEHGKGFDRFARYYLEGPFGFPSEHDHNDRIYFVDPE
jgi:hypothetical protein